MSCFSMVLVPVGVSVVELSGMGLWSEAVHQVLLGLELLGRDSCAG